MEKHIGKIINMPLFEGIKPDELKAMLFCLQGYIKEYKKGEYIIFEQDIVKNIGLIISGSIDMVKEDVWGNKTTLVRMGEKELFGETFACGENPSSSVTFLASSESEILFVPFAKVMHMCSNRCMFHHQMIENMVAIIASKNRQLMNKVEILSQKSIRGKLLAYLAFQSQEHGAKYFEIPFGRLELAEYLCIDRSAMTRELNNMKKDGIIDFDKNVFSIIEPINPNNK